MRSRTLTPALARKFIMAELIRVHAEGQRGIEFSNLVADEQDGFPNGVTFGTAIAVASERSHEAVTR